VFQRFKMLVLGIPFKTFGTQRTLGKAAKVAERWTTTRVLA